MGKGSGRRAGANDKAFLENCPFPSLLEKRKKGIEAYPKHRGTNHLKEELEAYRKEEKE